MITLISFTQMDSLIIFTSRNFFNLLFLLILVENIAASAILLFQSQIYQNLKVWNFKLNWQVALQGKNEEARG